MFGGRLAAVVMIAALVCGCGFRGRRGEWADVVEPERPAPIFSDGTTQYLHDELFIYKVGSGDGLFLEVSNHEEFSGQADVDQRGRLAVPNTDKVLEVESLSLDEIRGLVSEAVSPYLLGRPKVRVRLLRSASKFFYILGGVQRPGVYPMGAKVVRLREALGAAGFFSEYQADKRRVGIITPDPARPTYLITNGRHVLMGEDRHNVAIKPGDVIFVQNRIIYDIDRYLYELFTTTENVATTHDTVKFWEDAVDGEFGDFAAPRRGVTILY